MSMIEIKQSPHEGDALVYYAYLLGKKVGRAATRIYRNPDRLYLSEIGSSLPKFEIGTVLLLASVLDGIAKGLVVLDGGFEPDHRHSGDRSRLKRWYYDRKVFVSEDGHDLSGRLMDISGACRDILTNNSIAHSIVFL